MLNKWMGIGRLTKDPESRFFSNGDQQTTCSLVTSKTWKDRDTGEKKEKAVFHNLVFNRGLAKVAAEYLKKGSKIYVCGEIDNQSWEKDGQKHYKTLILVNEMNMLDSKPRCESSGHSADSSGHGGGSEPTQPDFDDDIPW